MIFIAAFNMGDFSAFLLKEISIGNFDQKAQGEIEELQNKVRMVNCSIAWPTNCKMLFVKGCNSFLTSKAFGFYTKCSNYADN